MTSQIKLKIIRVLDEHEVVIGIFGLGHRYDVTHNLCWLREKLRELEAEHIITIEDRGNGRAKIIKRNRNSPGYPRRIPRRHV